MPQQSPDIEEIKRKKVIKVKCEQSFLFFARYFFKQLRGGKFILNWHHEEIASTLEAIARYEIGHTVFNLPPRYTKTELVVILWISWCIAKNPRAKFIHLSYSNELALENSSQIKQLIESDAFQEFWPLKLKRDSRSKKKWYTEQGGGVYATSTGGQITGFGAGSMEDTEEFEGAIVIDDPHHVDRATTRKVGKADTTVERQKANNRLNTTINSRRNSRKTPIIIVMQRIHEDDMSAFALNGGIQEPFNHVCISAEQPGQRPLWAHKHTWDELKKIQRANSLVYSGQYLQAPTMEEGNILKTKHWKQWCVPGEDPDKSPAPPCTQIIQVYDTAFKTAEHNDYSARTTWGVFFKQDPDGKKVPCIILLERMNERLEFPDLKVKLKESAKIFKPDIILIEDKASGQSLLQEMRRVTDVSVKAVMVGITDKVSRAHFASSILSQGIVYYMARDWAEEVIQQCAKFPNAKHDDLVDTCVIAWEWLRQTFSISLRSDISFEEDVKRLNYPEQEKPSTGPLYA